ncbi:MAG: Gmad2 immunoglobulin-like domain-containing protein [bacterium]|nr:Gmad2 immunoglobulin-like domain-containing protein [bacterium]
MNQKILISSVLLVVLVILGIVLLFDIGRRAPESYLSIAGFQECIDAGYPALESYPRQCKTPDNRTFVEVIPEPVATPSEPDATTTTHSLIRVTSPKPQTIIKSPVIVKGEARGTWYFEASFPLKIVDANGKTLAEVPAQAEGEWMTEEFVPFEVSVPFATSTTKTGKIILMKDNPSGEPERDDSIEIPIIFAQ